MKQSVFFFVDASLIHHLGASLISNDLQALTELVKNSYDADATNVKIIINAPTEIVVEDNGSGMDVAAIKRGWLTLSNSIKVEQKLKGLLTRNQQRTPLGDKGLGRLSTQRLGNRLEIETTPEDSDQTYRVEINWKDFRAGQELGQIAVAFEELPKGSKLSGTKLVISDLTNPSGWEHMSSAELRLNLARLISPYSDVSSFRIQAFLNGVEVSPNRLTENMRNAAMLKIGFAFDGKQLSTWGSIKGRMLKGQKKDSEDFTRYFNVDNGAGFLAYLMSDRKSQSYKIKGATTQDFFIEYRASRSFDDITANTPYLNPGPFHGEIDSINLAQLDAEDETIEVLNSPAALRQLLRDLSGIRVYRDNFIVQTSPDWLKLGEGQTSGGSYYGLRPGNTMGYVAISARDNSQLTETTNREGFVDDEYYHGFYEILQAVTRTTSMVTEHFRRSWLEYVKQQEAQRQELPTRDPEVIERRINQSFSMVNDAADMLGDASRVLSDTIAQDASSLFPGDDRVVRKMSEVQEILTQASSTLRSAAARDGLAKLLASEVDLLSARISEVYELVSLGITVEALSHDISIVLGRLNLETNRVLKHAQTIELSDLEIRRYFEIVRTAIIALEKQMGHIDPALKYLREKRERFPVSKFLFENESYYRDRLTPSSIALETVVKNDFSIKFSKGKLVQIIDNLVLNSEYWLEALKDSTIEKRISITIDKPSLILEDTGPGVEPPLEETLFDPFVTAKPRGKGRGLGLFIATQLLELDGCELRLMTERNQGGRRYRFNVDLTGVIEDA